MISRIKKLFKKIPKPIAAAIATIAIIAIPATVLAGFGPERPTFDYNKWDPNLSCTDPAQAWGRCGSMTGPVFDSFKNAPSYGDERNFARVARVTDNTTNGAIHADYTETQTAVPGQEYWVRTYVHNNANPATNTAAFNYIGIAHNTRVRVQVPSGVFNGGDIGSYVSATNATPNMVWDTATLTNPSQSFSLAYVPGSAVLVNPAHTGGIPLSDNVVSANGTPIGFGEFNGDLPGCFEFVTWVYVKVKVQAPALTVNKLVRAEGATTFQDSITAKKTDKIQWRIEYKNSGNGTANHVTVRDTLPKGVTLVPGSIKRSDASVKNQPLPDNALNEGGIDLGQYGPAGNDISGVITFETTINPDLKDCELENVAFVRGEEIPETSDKSKVVIENCKPTTPPTNLPNTGPGDLVGIFVATTVAGALAYRFVWLKRLGA